MNDEQKELFLSEKLKEFTDKLNDAAINVISDVYCAYLPHVLSDTETNTNYQTEEAIRKLLTGKFEVIGDYIKIGDLMIWMKNPFENIATNIYNQVPDKIENQTIKELQDEVKKWKNMYWSR